jgi:hypothetical protein
MRMFFRLFLFFILGFVSISGAWAQQSINSVYSRYGLGKEDFGGFTPQRSLGGIASGVRSSTYMNYDNPASLTSLALTTFQAGINGQNVWQQQGDEKLEDRQGYFGFLSIGFPVKKWWGTSAGLIPFSRMGYNYADTTIQQTYRVRNFTSGNGGVNKVYWHNGISPFKWFSDSLKSDLSIGLGGSYVFGYLSQMRQLTFLNTDTSHHHGTSIGRETTVRGLQYVVSLQYAFPIKKDIEVVLGGFYGLEANLNANINSSLARFRPQGPAQALIDTVYKINNQKEEIVYPAILGGGFTVNYKGNWLLGFDYKLTQWSRFSLPYDNQSMVDQQTICAGLQYYPATQAGTGFFKHTYYRIGFRNTATPLIINNQRIYENVITAGLGLPLKKTTSTINIGIELGQRGTLNNNLLREQFVMAQLGIILNDRWFIRRRID